MYSWVACLVCHRGMVLSALPEEDFRYEETHVIYGGSAEEAYAVMFQTDDLPEGKAMHAMIDLAKKPTDEQDEFISRYSSPKTITVTCETVEVVEIFNSQNGKSVKLAHGKKCSLDSLE